MQKSADAVLVPIHEFGDDFCRRALQHGSGLVPVAAAGDVEPRARFVSGMVLVQPACGHVSLGAGVAPLLPWWIPAGQPPSQFFDMIGRHPGVPVMLAWSVVLFVTVLLCIDPESREHLLGHGGTLSLISTGMLLLVLTMTVVGWSLTY